MALTEIEQLDNSWSRGNPRDGGLVGSGCLNRIAQTAELKQRNVVSHSSGGQVMDPGAGRFQVRALSLVCNGGLLAVPSHGLSSVHANREGLGL